jgi:hypothetical protein
MSDVIGCGHVRRPSCSAWLVRAVRTDLGQRVHGDLRCRARCGAIPLSPTVRSVHQPEGASMTTTLVATVGQKFTSLKDLT